MAVDWYDVQTTVGRPLTAAEQAQATLWIMQARLIITNRLGNLLDLDQPTLDMVVTEAVANRIKRPDSATQVSVSVDDAQESRTYQSGTGQIQILDEWWEMLTPDGVSTAFSIHPYREVPDAG